MSISMDGLFNSINDLLKECEEAIAKNEKKVKRLNNISSEIANQVAIDLQPKMNELKDEALAEYYKHDEGSVYKRTNNFKTGVKTSVSSEGSGLYAITNEGEMSDYPSFFGGSSLPAADAFDKFFKEGKHGEGRWLLPPNTYPTPEEYIQQQIESGRLSPYINRAIEKRINDILNDD